MAENVKRGYFEVLDELFTGPSAALEKYAKVRFTQYEMNLWRRHHLPLKEVDKRARRYFHVRFLGEGETFDKAPPEVMNKAFESLTYAVGLPTEDKPTLNSGCHQRCLKLVLELNDILKADGLREITDPEKFLNLMTFDYDVLSDENGVAIACQSENAILRYQAEESSAAEDDSIYREVKLLLSKSPYTPKDLIADGDITAVNIETGSILEYKDGKFYAYAEGQTKVTIEYADGSVAKLLVKIENDGVTTTAQTTTTTASAAKKDDGESSSSVMMFIIIGIVVVLGIAAVIFEYFMIVKKREPDDDEFDEQSYSKQNDPNAPAQDADDQDYADDEYYDDEGYDDESYDDQGYDDQGYDDQGYDDNYDQEPEDK